MNGKIGGWIETEDNLSQYDDCWVDDEAIVYQDAEVAFGAQVYDKAIISSGAQILGKARVYGNARVENYAEVAGNSQVYERALISFRAVVHQEAQVYGEAVIDYYAQVYGKAQVFGNAWISGKNINITGHAQVGENFRCFTELYLNQDKFYGNNDIKQPEEEYIKAFIDKVEESNKFLITMDYDSIDEFFNSIPKEFDINRDAITILTAKTKYPLIKIEKALMKGQSVYKYIVDITNDNADGFKISSIIYTKDQFNKLLQTTLESLNNYAQFYLYISEFENIIN